MVKKWAVVRTNGLKTLPRVQCTMIVYQAWRASEGRKKASLLGQRCVFNVWCSRAERWYAVRTHVNNAHCSRISMWASVDNRLFPVLIELTRTRGVRVKRPGRKWHTAHYQWWTVLTKIDLFWPNRLHDVFTEALALRRWCNIKLHISIEPIMRSNSIYLYIAYHINAVTVIYIHQHT